MYRRGSVWWVQYYRNGICMRESSRSASAADAKRLLQLREGTSRAAFP